MDAAHHPFRRLFGFNPVWVARAPGRLELLGNHTDYNDGLVLSLAVDHALTMAVAPRSDGRVELASNAFPGRELFSVTQLVRGPKGAWTNYIKGVLDQLRRHGVPLRGFTAAVDSRIPVGGGLSSSAALEVATALAYRQLYPYTLTDTGITVPPARDRDGALAPLTKPERIQIARACRQAENDFVGLQCGLLDQISCLFGKEFHAIELDCQSLAIEWVPLFGDIAWVVFDSGVQHHLVQNEYNDRRDQCAAAARLLGARSLRQLEPRDLENDRAKLSAEQYACARHVLEEIRRVLFGVRALRDNDFAQFGHYMKQSHASSRDWFRNSCPELDCLVDLACAHPACLGARLTGGGFGGSTISLVTRDGLEAFLAHVSDGFEKETGRKPPALVCRASDGANIQAQ